MSQIISHIKTGSAEHKTNHEHNKRLADELRDRQGTAVSPSPPILADGKRPFSPLSPSTQQPKTRTAIFFDK